MFRNDAHCRTEGFTPAARLDYHRKHSLPQMEAMASRAQSDFDHQLVEPNSTLGRTYRYFLGHYDPSIAFCLEENAEVCNNLAECRLKAFICQRKASLFFKSTLGATVADILSSLVITAHASTPERMALARERIVSFRRELMAFLEAGEANTLYHLAIQLFPLSSPTEESTLNG